MTRLTDSSSAGAATAALSTSRYSFHIVTALLALTLLFCSLQSAHAAEAQKQPIRVASKMDTEGALLGNILVQMLQVNNIPVINKVSMATSNIVRKALVNGEIDLYPEYTGNGAYYSHRPDDPVWRDAKEGYEAVKAWDKEHNDLIWLTPSPASNGWAIAVVGTLAKTAKLQTLADLATYVNGGGTIKLAASAEFIDNPLALPGFQQSYGFTLKKSQLLVLSGGNTAATIQAAAMGTNGSNAAMVYGTDGAIDAAGLVVLDDPHGVQAVYAPTPVIREAVLQEYPQVATILAPVFKALDRATLQKLNGEIQVMGLPAEEVARTWLIAQGFLK